MEWKRILCQRKFLLFVIAVFLINFLLFVSEQIGNRSLEELLAQKEIRREYVELCRNMDDIDLAISLISEEMKENEVFLSLLYYNGMKAEDQDAYQEYGKKEEAKLRKLQPKISHSFDEKVTTLEKSKLLARQRIYGDLLKELEYLKTYPGYLEKIQEQVIAMKNISIFNKEDSFSYRNILKTEQDYSKLGGVNVTFGNNQPITSVINYETNHYMLLLLVAALTLQMIRERQIGIWTLIHSTPRGRVYLFIKRCLILLSGSTLITICDYLGLFLVSREIYGEPDVGRSVQSIEQFHEITANISIGSFLVLLMLVKIVSLFLLSLLIWFIYCFVDSKALQLGTFGIVIGMEFIAYRWIPPLSNWNVIKYVNLFYYINPTEIMVSYRNLFIFNKLVNLKVLFFIILTTFTVLLIIGCQVTNVRKKPIHPVPKYVSHFHKLMKIFPKGKINLSLFQTEFYKIFFFQKGCLVLLVLIFLQVNSLERNELYFSSEEKLMNQFFEEVGGIPDEKVYSYIDNLHSTLQKVELEYYEIADLYREGQISSNEYEEASLKYTGYEGQRKALLTMQGCMQYIMEMKEKTGSQVWLVNPRGYEYLMGEEAFSKHATTAFEAVFCVILLISGIFSFEKHSGSLILVRSTQKGRRGLFRIKLKAAATVVLLIWSIIYGFEIGNAYHYYRLSYLDAPIQSLSMFRDFTFSFSIGTVLALVYLLRLLLLLATAAIAIWMSLLLRDNSIPITVATLLTTSFLYIIGLSEFSSATIVVPIGFFQMLFEGISPVNLIVICLLLIGGVISIDQSRRIWCGHSILRGKDSDDI